MVENRPPEVDGIRVPYEKSISELQALLTDDKSHRWVAIVAIACSSEAGALEALSELISSPDAYVRRFALQWLGKRPDGTDCAYLIVERLGDQDERVVRTAIQVARELRITKARPAVLGLLEDPEASTRQTALGALDVLGHADDFELLLSRFQRDPSEEVRRTAGWTLFERRSAETAPRLVELWKVDALSRHRKWACQLAREFPEASFKEAIAPLLEDPDGHVRNAAQRALERLAQSVDP
jgi:HEAT repeat protein